ncbi:hypothetical protein MES4922_610011 [Mesorhizobium ventifaucium]|uniref:Secreted protein n=1 Tax=Mesorhizobium ventifaucium TaxID=666020 RepID=A0ABM9EET6_9HYPH|nr:hypothetical protein MES4922_610011 [Mesorhizobium ventifaucium]
MGSTLPYGWLVLANQMLALGQTRSLTHVCLAPEPIYVHIGTAGTGPRANRYPRMRRGRLLL